ncbi:amino acid ABC transporter permease [Castellaniella sp.]|uniref:amino acid ABC transporter permease n=1 Tax=Castellaniella sp. TaxID=1955812 RepID=UPI00355F0EA8
MMNLIHFYMENGADLLQGFWYTIQLCFLGVLGAAIFGAIIFLLSTIKLTFVTWLYRLYVDSVRGIPLLILLFLLYFAGPRVGLLLSAYMCGVVGIIVYGSAYFSEIYRAGYASIPTGQIEAARCLGIGRRHILFRIRLPYMSSLLLPQVTNQAIVLIKESAVLSVITVHELTFVTGDIINRTYEVVLPYVAAGLLYWIFVQAVDTIGQFAERFTHSSRIY